MARTSTPEATLTAGEALVKYAGLKDEIDVLVAQRDEAMKSIAPLDEAIEAKRSEVGPLVDAMGADPFNVLKSGKAGRKTGPRDPQKRQSVLDAMTGKTVDEIAQASGQDKPYINGVINSLKSSKTADVTVEGERGAYRYTYVAPAA